MTLLRTLCRLFPRVFLVCLCCVLSLHARFCSSFTLRAGPLLLHAFYRTKAALCGVPRVPSGSFDHPTSLRLIAVRLFCYCTSLEFSSRGRTLLEFLPATALRLGRSVAVNDSSDAPPLSASLLHLMRVRLAFGPVPFLDHFGHWPCCWPLANFDADAFTLQPIAFYIYICS